MTALSCKTTKVESFLVPGVESKTYNRLLVVATHPGAGEREEMEDALCDALNSLGLTTEKGREVLPPPADRTRKAYLSAFADHDLEGVLVVSPAGRGSMRSLNNPWGIRDRQIEEPSTGCNPKDGGFGPRFQVRDFSATDEMIAWQETVCSLFDVESGELVWEASLRSRVTARTPFATLAVEQARAAAKQIIEDRMVRP